MAQRFALVLLTAVISLLATGVLLAASFRLAVPSSVEVVEPPLHVATIFPDSGGNSGTVTVTIRGSNFHEGAVATLLDEGVVLNGENTVVLSSEEMTTTFDLRGQSPRSLTMEVANPDGETFTVLQPFVVESGGEPELWVDVIGRSILRVGPENTFEVRVGNSGNVDAYDVVLEITGPRDAQFDVDVPRPEIEGINWDDVLLGAERDSEVDIPIWIYRVPANSSDELQLKIVLPTDQWEGGESVTIRAELRQQPSEFSVSGDLDLLEQSPTFLDLRSSLWDSMRRVSTERGVPLVQSDLEKAEELLKFEMKNEALSLLFGAPAVYILVSAGGGWALAGGALAIVLLANSGQGLFQSLTNVYRSLADATYGALSGRSWDPNDKAGPSGVGEDGFISGNQGLEYTLFFENLEAATLPAQEVVITDQLDVTNLRLSTFKFGGITIGDREIVPPHGRTQFVTNLDLRPENDLIVRILAWLDTDTGLLTYQFTSIDSQTGLPTEDPLAGFLPPNISPPEGEGSAAFSVMFKDDLPTGTELRNKATIIFDVNPPIDTPEWRNTVDNRRPVSQVAPLSPTQESNSFPVQWTGSDEGSGIKDYTIYVSEEGGHFTPWLLNTTETSGTFAGLSDRKYDFYSIARDQVLNLEQAPVVPDASTITAVVLCGDQDDDGQVDVFDAIIDLQIIVGLIVPTPEQLFLSDVIRNGQIDVFDVILTLQDIVGLAEITECGPLTT